MTHSKRFLCQPAFCCYRKHSSTSRQDEHLVVLHRGNRPVRLLLTALSRHDHIETPPRTASRFPSNDRSLPVATWDSFTVPFIRIAPFLSYMDCSFSALPNPSARSGCAQPTHLYIARCPHPPAPQQSSQRNQHRNSPVHRMLPLSAFPTAVLSMYREVPPMEVHASPMMTPGGVASKILIFFDEDYVTSCRIFV